MRKLDVRQKIALFIGLLGGPFCFLFISLWGSGQITKIESFSATCVFLLGLFIVMFMIRRKDEN